MKTAIIIGASSGIGRALALEFALAGYTMGITARRNDLLLELAQEIDALGGGATVQAMDIADTQASMKLLEELLGKIGGADVIVVNAAIGEHNASLDWDTEARVIAVNVTGFAAMANVAMKHFLQRGAGHLVGISSISAVRGNGTAPGYAASKAFMSNYLQGLRNIAVKNDTAITVTDIKPGFVKTDMTARNERMFWVASAQKAARQIFTVIQQKRVHAYITRRWRLVAWLIKLLPEWLYNRMM